MWREYNYFACICDQVYVGGPPLRIIYITFVCDMNQMKALYGIRIIEQNLVYEVLKTWI